MNTLFWKFIDNCPKHCFYYFLTTKYLAPNGRLISFDLICQLKTSYYFRGNTSLSLNIYMKFLAQLVVSALAVIITSFILTGVHMDSAVTGVLVAIVLSVLNTIVKPILVILTIPITIFTLGLFLLIINAGMILLAGEIVPGFSVNGFWTAFFFSIILSVVTSIFNMLVKDGKG